MSATQEDEEGKQALLGLETHLASVPDWMGYSGYSWPAYGGPPNYNRLFQLLKENPHLAKRCVGGSPMYRRETFALNYLLAAKAPLEMVQEVYRMHPDALKTVDNFGGLPLHHSTSLFCDLPVIEFLLTEFPPAAAERPPFGPFGGNYPLESLVRSIESRFNFSQEQFTKVVQLLHNAHPPSQWDKAEAYGWGYALSRLLLSANAPSSLLVWLAEQEKKDDDEGCCIRFDGEDDYLDEWAAPALIRNLNHFVPSLKCKKLTLFGSNCGISGEFLRRLVARVMIAPTLSLCLNMFDVTLYVDWDDSVEKWDSCPLKELTLVDLQMGDDDCQRFLSSLQSLPSLEKLDLRFTPGLFGTTHPLGTAAIIDLLEASPKLQSLSLSGSSLLETDTQHLCQALKTSNSTAFVRWTTKVEQETQATHANQEIAYYSALNHCGRTKMTAMEASKEDLVEGLNSLFHLEGANGIPYLKESVSYGLLRQVPGLWALTPEAAGEKRPWLDTIEGEKMKKQKVKT